MNILVIRTHRFGDILQLTPMLQGLKKKFPSGKITFLTGSDMADLVSCNPDVDEVISIPEKEYQWYLKNKPEYYAKIYNEFYDIASKLKENKFQLIINRQYEFGGILAWLVDAEEILGGGFSPERGFVFKDDASKELFETIRTNRNLNNRNLVDWGCRIAGISPGCGKMVFYVPEIARTDARHLLSRGGAKDDDLLVAVQMGAARSFRQWGPENYAHVIKWLIKDKNKKVVLLGSGDEKELSEIIRNNLGSENVDVIDLIGKTDLNTLGGVLELCQYLITGDTGTMHMATSVGTPVLALFYGTAYPWETGPYGMGHLVLYADVPCSPCLVPEECTFEHKCLKAITPRHVCKAFEVAESISKDNLPPFTWPENKIKLFLTHLRSGFDQTLISINNINKMAEEILPLLDKSRKNSFENDGIESVVNMLRNQSGLLVKQFYLGNRQYFLDAFSEFVDQLDKTLKYLNGTRHSKDFEETLSRELVTAISEAYMAFQSEDFVTVLDIVQYRFNAIIEKLEYAGGIAHGA